MRLCCFFLGLLLLIPAPALAQVDSAETELAARTEKLLDALYQKAGPGLGSILYEPGVVIALAGLSPTSHALDAVREEDIALLPALNGILEPVGARLVARAGSDSLTVESLPGLQRFTEATTLPFVSKFQAEQGWDALSLWYESLEKSLETEHPGKANSMVYDIRSGETDSAILAAGDPAGPEILYARLPYATFLSGEAASLTVQPADAGAAAVRAAMSDRSEFLKAFYTSPAVRARLRSPDFLQARKVRRPRADSASENWFRGEKLGYGLTDYEPCPLLAEQLLIDHQDELVAMLEGGATPMEMLAALNEWAAERGMPGRISEMRLQDWVWAGAYSGAAPARARLYHAVQAVKPEALSAMAENRVRYWKESAEGAKKPDAERALETFRHPEVLAYYATLAPAEQKAIRESLEELSFDIGIRSLLAAPPFAP